MKAKLWNTKYSLETCLYAYVMGNVLCDKKGSCVTWTMEEMNGKSYIYLVTRLPRIRIINFICRSVAHYKEFDHIIVTIFKENIKAEYSKVSRIPNPPKSK